MGGHDGSNDEALSVEAATDVEVVAGGGAVQIVGQICQRVVSLGFQLIAVRILGFAGYGLYRKVQQILALAGQLGLAGFNYASMRFIARARAAADPGGVRGAARVGLTGVLISSSIVLVLVIVAAGPLAELFTPPGGDAGEVARLLRIASPYVPLFALMQTLRYCTQAYKTMVPSVIVGNIIQPLVRFAVGAGALLAGFAVAGALSSLVFSMGVGALMGAWYFRRMLTREELLARPKAQPRPMVRFALLQAGASLLGIQVLGLGILVLSVYRGNQEVGLFGLALSVQGPGTVFLGGIVNIWAPVVADLHDKGEIARLDSLYKTITRWVATFSFPVFAALIIEPDVFVEVMAGDKSSAVIERAALVTAILAAGNLFYTGTGPTGYVISMTGRPGVNFANSVAAVALYLGLGLMFVPRYGAVGMAAVDAGVTALINAARVVQAKVLVGVQPFGRSFFKPVLATGGGALILLAWKLVPGESIPLDIAGLAIAAVVYLGLLRALGMDPEERHVWQRIKARTLRGRGPKA